jgi:proteic killer suppression protein
MIRTFKDKNAEKIFTAEYVYRLPWEIQKIAYRRVLNLHAAKILGDLSVIPGNRLEKLKGHRAGQYSIRVYDRWRVCLNWVNGNAEDVEIVDYHE